MANVADKTRNEAIREVVIPVLARIAGISEAEISDDQDLIRDMSMDSLAVLEVAVDLEAYYEIKIDDEDLDDIYTVGDILAYIEERMRKDEQQ